MKILDLFAGLGGWSNCWREAGHDVYSVDLDSQFHVDSHADILTLRGADLPWRPDILLASPPCEGFSVMNIGRNWHYDGTPKTDTARMARMLVTTTVLLIEELRPSFWIIENPRAKLRSLSLLDFAERRTVTYCQYGLNVMKPTDLWGGFPPSLVLKAACKNGAPCHIAAPRGSRTGTQGPSSSAEKAKIPDALARSVMDACLRDGIGQNDR